MNRKLAVVLFTIALLFSGCRRIEAVPAPEPSETAYTNIYVSQGDIITAFEPKLTTSEGVTEQSGVTTQPSEAFTQSEVNDSRENSVHLPHHFAVKEHFWLAGIMVLFFAALLITVLWGRKIFG